VSHSCASSSFFAISCRDFIAPHKVHQQHPVQGVLEGHSPEKKLLLYFAPEVHRFKVGLLGWTWTWVLPGIVCFQYLLFLRHKTAKPQFG
jgi:hypothetical protein